MKLLTSLIIMAMISAMLAVSSAQLLDGLKRTISGFSSGGGGGSDGNPLGNMHNGGSGGAGGGSPLKNIIGGVGSGGNPLKSILAGGSSSSSSNESKQVSNSPPTANDDTKKTSANSPPSPSAPAKDEAGVSKSAIGDKVTQSEGGGSTTTSDGHSFGRLTGVSIAVSFAVFAAVSMGF